MTRRILLVEDTEDNRQIVRDLMESVGYDLIEAEDGAAGVAMAAEHRPDLILMDIQLPVMDGYEACRRGDEEKTRASGCDGYVAKPFTPRQRSLNTGSALIALTVPGPWQPSAGRDHLGADDEARDETIQFLNQHCLGIKVNERSR